MVHRSTTLVRRISAILLYGLALGLLLASVQVAQYTRTNSTAPK